jgi:hypothetical protein
MIRFRKPLLIVALFALLAPGRSFGQYLFQVEPFFNYFSDAGRYELCGNLVLPQARYDGVIPVYNGNTFKGDSTMRRTIDGAMGYGASIGLSIPIKATGHISCWAAHVELMGNFYSWQDLNQKMGVDGTFSSSSTALTATTIQIGLPLGVEWKAGCDAILSQRLNFGTSLGAGFIPQVNMTSLDNVSNIDSRLAFGFRPYLKAEGAVFIGMCVKLRAMYSAGDIMLIDANKAIPTMTDGPFRVMSNGAFMLSLIIMPFSGHWGEYSWWNTYDTYNQHDRLN